MKTHTTVLQRRARVRAKVAGTAERPRLTVHITNRHVTVQLIDDVAGRTLGYVTTVKAKDARGAMTDKAVWAGTQIGAVAKKAGITKVVFDRAGKVYHGRLAALAAAARESGLEF